MIRTICNRAIHNFLPYTVIFKDCTTFIIISTKQIFNLYMLHLNNDKHQTYIIIRTNFQSSLGDVFKISQRMAH